MTDGAGTKMFILTEDGTFWAFNDEGIVALFDSGAKGGIEYQTIRTHLLGHLAPVAVVVLVALEGIPVEPIIRGAGELLGGGNAWSRNKRTNAYTS